MGLLHTAKKKEAKRESDKPAVEARAKHHPAQHKRAEPKGVRNTAAVLPAGQSQQPPDDGDESADGGDAGGDESLDQSQDGGEDDDAGQQPQGSADQAQDDQGEDEQESSGGGDQDGPPSEDDNSEDPGAEQNTGVMGSPNDDTGGLPQSTTPDGVPQAPMSPALKEEYQLATQALYTALYQNDTIAQAILKGIPEQGPMKVKGVAHLAVILFGQLNKKLQLSVHAPQIVLPFTKDIVAHILDLIQQVRGTQYSEQEAVGALGMAYEMVMRVCGISKKNVQAVTQNVPRSVLSAHLQKYHQTNMFVKSGVDPNGFHNPQLQQQEQAGGAPPAAGAPPQGAAPSPGAGGPPPSGPPSGGAPPAGPAAGGMMAQAQAAGGQ